MRQRVLFPEPIKPATTRRSCRSSSGTCAAQTFSLHPKAAAISQRSPDLSRTSTSHTTSQQAAAKCHSPLPQSSLAKATVACRGPSIDWKSSRPTSGKSSCKEEAHKLRQGNRPGEAFQGDLLGTCFLLHAQHLLYSRTLMYLLKPSAFQADWVTHDTVNLTSDAS